MSLPADLFLAVAFVVVALFGYRCGYADGRLRGRKDNR